MVSLNFNMTIYLKKFGDILTSRQDGKEALAAFNPTLNQLTDDDEIVIDFEGVSVLTPAWGGEFITALVQRFGEKRIKLINTANSSVQATVGLLKKVNRYNLMR